MKKGFYIAISLVFMGFTACKQEPSFKVEGEILGAAGKQLHLEQMGLEGITSLDSVKIKEDGRFCFEAPRPESPEFYRLRVDRKFINFSVDSTENLVIHADYNRFSTDYQIEGSDNSQKIKELVLLQADLQQNVARFATSGMPIGIVQDSVASCVDAYKKTNGAPISFELMLKMYQEKMQNADKDDSVTSVLKLLVRSNLFEKEDKVQLTDECFIIKMDAFPKDGPIAKAIVYFVVAKLNLIYEQLDKQAVNDDYVQIRHFTIIDEAHYMLDFDNRPLRNLIAVGRNKGLSIILATQNMESFKSKHFDFYANAQYPLIMKQQTISDPVIKDLFGVSGKELQEIRSAIAGLQKGELIIKDQNAFLLDIGKKYKKIKVSHLI